MTLSGCGAEREAGFDIRVSCSKHEYPHIPMRDGVELFTAVYIPKDEFRLYPMLMRRTPHALQCTAVRPYGETAYPDRRGPSELLT